MAYKVIPQGISSRLSQKLCCSTTDEKPLVDERGDAWPLDSEIKVYNDALATTDSIWWWNGAKWIKY